MPATSRHQPSARLLVLLALLALALPSRAAGASAGPPVVLLPGIAGSQLEILLGDSYVAPHFYCRQHSAEWKRVWFQLKDYVATDCLAHELHVNVEGGARYTNSAGVRVRAVDFGGVDGIKCLDSAFCSLTAYFQPVISLLEENGYRVNDTIFGAPYDFRMAGDGLTQVGFEAALTELIEDVVAKRGGERVVLVAHSMGGMVATYFLAGKSQNWTRAHVAGLVTISSPYAGSPMALQGSVSGDPIGLPFDHDAFLGIQGNSPSGPWLYPAVGLGNTTESVLVRTKGKDYAGTLEGYRALLSDLGREEQRSALDFVRSLRGIDFDREGGPGYPDLGLGRPPTCFHGIGVRTPAQFTYDVAEFSEGMDPKAPTVTEFTDGDGVVHLESLAYCQRLGGDAIAIENQSHVGILGSKDLHLHLLDVLARSRSAEDEVAQ